MERGFQHLREPTVQEIIYSDLGYLQTSTDPDEVQCRQPMWQKFIQRPPPSYARALAGLAWTEDLMVDWVAGQIRD